MAIPFRFPHIHHTCIIAFFVQIAFLTFQVAWLRVDTQTILTIHSHIITKNVRIGVTHSERRTWFLHIKDLRESDRGWYMCQINTDPMKSQVGYLDVVGEWSVKQGFGIGDDLIFDLQFRRT